MPRRLTDKEADRYIVEALDELAETRSSIAEFHRRARFAARDGFPSGAGGGGGSERPDPTAQAATAPPMYDPTLRDILSVDRLIAEIGKRAEQLRNIRQRLDSTVEEGRGRQSTVQACDCCHRTVSGVENDRRRDGFCRSCYGPWLKFRAAEPDPSRNVFIARRQAELGSESATPTEDVSAAS